MQGHPQGPSVGTAEAQGASVLAPSLLPSPGLGLQPVRTQAAESLWCQHHRRTPLSMASADSTRHPGLSHPQGPTGAQGEAESLG